MHCVIEHPANHGLADILFNVTHNHHKTEQYLGDGHRWGVKIGYACERVRERLKTMSRPFGSAVDMRHVQDSSGFFDEAMPVLCSDALTDSNIGAALHEHRTEGAFANVVALDAPSADVQNYGTMVAAEGGEIQSAEAPPCTVRPDQHWLAPTFTLSNPKSSNGCRPIPRTTLTPNCAPMGHPKTSVLSPK